MDISNNIRSEIFAENADASRLFFSGMEGNLLPMRYINGQGTPATTYPHNSNVSPDGRVTV